MEEPEPNPASVEVLHEAAERLIEDERERGRALDAKTAQLAAFSGTILTLDVALGTFAFKESLGCGADLALPIFFLLAATGLLAAAAFSVAGVLMPQAYLAISRTAVSQFARHPLLSSDPVQIHGRLLVSITDEQLPRERERNDRKATWTGRAARSLLIGLFGIAGQAATLGIDQLWDLG